MKESTNSLRLFFGAVGLLTAWSVYSVFSIGIPSGFQMVLTAYDALVILTYLYFAWTLPSFLTPSKVRTPMIFVIATLIIETLLMGYSFLLDPELFYTGAFVAAVSVLVSLYLIRQLKKLSK